MKWNLIRAGLVAGLMAVTAGAQQTTPAPGESGTGSEQRKGQQKWGHHRHHRRGGGGIHGGGMTFLRQLNLTDAQRQQVRTIGENYAQVTKGQREELRQIYGQKRQGTELSAEQQARAGELQQQLRDAAERMRGEMLAVLTPEQRAEFDRLKQEREARREERRRARQNNTQ